MSWYTMIAIGIIALSGTIIGFLLVWRRFGSVGARYFIAILGSVLVGMYIATVVFWKPNSPWDCAQTPFFNRSAAFFYFDMPMGTLLRWNNFYEAPYPEVYLTEVHVLNDVDVMDMDGKVLCVDGHEGQLLLTTMLEGCNEE